MVANGIAQGPGTHTVDNRGLAQTGQGSVVKVAVQNLEGFADRGSAQVERCGDSAGPF